MPAANRIETSCATCHKMFMAKPSEIAVGRKFCSRACYTAANVKHLIECVCGVCGTTFEVKAYKRDSAKYCSRKCKGIARRTKTDFPCMLCGNLFKTWPSAYGRWHKYCSEECSRKALSLSKQGAQNPAWRGGCRQDRGRNWSAQRKLAQKRDGDICQHCGKQNRPGRRKFAVHHIKPYREFHGDYVTANQLSNLIVLCRTCHEKAESGKIAIQPKLL